MKSGLLNKDEKSLLKQNTTIILPGNKRIIICDELTNEADSACAIGWIITETKDEKIEKIGQYKTLMLTRIHFPGEFEMSIGGTSWLFKTFRVNYYSKNGFINGMAFPFISERKDHNVLWTSGVILAADIKVLDGTDTNVHKGIVIGYIKG